MRALTEDGADSEAAVAALTRRASPASQDRQRTRVALTPTVSRVMALGSACGVTAPGIVVCDSGDCGHETSRAVFDKSHNRQASSARRLVIEATYPP